MNTPTTSDPIAVARWFIQLERDRVDTMLKSLRLDVESAINRPSDRRRSGTCNFTNVAADLERSFILIDAWERLLPATPS